MDRMNWLHTKRGELSRQVLLDEEGQSMVEYGLIIALLILGAMVALVGFSTGASDLYQNSILNVLEERVFNAGGNAP